MYDKAVRRGYDTAIGENIRVLRQSRGMDADAAAAALSLTADQLRKIERGATRLPINLVPTLCRLLETDPDTLLKVESEIAVHLRADPDARALAAAFARISDPATREALLNFAESVAGDTAQETRDREAG